MTDILPTLNNLISHHKKQDDGSIQPLRFSMHTMPIGEVQAKLPQSIPMLASGEPLASTDHNRPVACLAADNTKAAIFLEIAWKRYIRGR
jgi:hypothetical protein